MTRIAKKIKSLLIQPDGQRIVEELVSSGLITSHDVVNIGYRKAQLEQFRRMLGNPEEVRAYADRDAVRTDQPEKAWQRFLTCNDWIFGFGLDYRCLGILQDEAAVGWRTWRGGTLPSRTFSSARAISQWWLRSSGQARRCSGEAEYAPGRGACPRTDKVGSQVLQQKAVWQVKAATNAAGNYDRHGALIRHSTADPKCILVIGNNDAFWGAMMPSTRQSCEPTSSTGGTPGT